MGARSWISVGLISTILMSPLEAFPPACSMIYAMGLHSYCSRSCVEEEEEEEREEEREEEEEEEWEEGVEEEREEEEGER